MIVRDRDPRLRSRGLTAATALGLATTTLAAACSGPTAPPVTAESSPPSKSAEPFFGCHPDVTIDGRPLTISNDSSKATTLGILAGIVRLPNGEFIGHPVYVLENGRQDVTTIRRLGNGAFVLASPAVPIQDVTVYIRPGFKTSNDGCNVVPSFDRQPQEQIVTTTGTVVNESTTDSVGGSSEYAGFGYGTLYASSAIDAYNDGAIGLPMTGIPGSQDFQETTLSNQH